MLEFTSVSVSSYEAATLSDALNAHAADGWSVVQIVPAGTVIVAYLSRPATGAPSDAATTASAATAAVAATAAATPVVDAPAPAPAPDQFNALLLSVSPARQSQQQRRHGCTTQCSTTAGIRRAAPSRLSLSLTSQLMPRIRAAVENEMARAPTHTAVYIVV